MKIPNATWFETVLRALQNNPIGAVCLIAVSAMVVVGLAVWKH